MVKLKAYMCLLLGFPKASVIMHECALFRKARIKTHKQCFLVMPELKRVNGYYFESLSSNIQ